MIRCDIYDKGFKRRDNMLCHKRIIHGADDEKLADEYNKSDFEYDDDIDSDQEASGEKEEEEASDEEKEPWNEIIDEAFKECQSKFEDRVKDLMDSENLDQRSARSVAFKHCCPCIERLSSTISWKRCCGISPSNMIAFSKLLKNL